MFEYVCIFTTGGVVLWCRAFCEMKLDILNAFIKNILLAQQTAKTQYNFGDCILKWKVQNDLQLVFAIIYKEILQLAFVEDLLDMMRYEFVTKIHPVLPRSGDVYLTLPQFDQNFNTVMAVWEAR
jgi:signal recognition particle receptor subunit alpha